MGVGRVVQAALAVILDPLQVVLDIVLTLLVEHHKLSVVLFFWTFSYMISCVKSCFSFV
jgi:hypothetical protein